MRFLGDPIWQFVFNATFALLTIFVTVLIYRKQQSRRSITYKIITDTKIFSLTDEVKGKVKVLFDEKPVENIRFVVFKIWNSGNSPILESEYNETMRFEFGENEEVLDTDVIEVVPSHIKDKVKASLKIKGGKVVLEPMLLNPKDALTLTVILAQTQVKGDLKVHARIAGVTQIVNFDKLPPIFFPLARIAAYISYIAFLSLVTYLILSEYVSNRIEKLIDLLFIFIYAFLYVLSFIILSSFFYSFMFKVDLIEAFSLMFKKLVDILKFMISPAD